MSNEILTTLESISKADVTATGNIRIGIAEAGIRHDMSRPPDLAAQFQMAKDCAAFDYLDKTPPRAQLAEYARLSERFDLPILAGGWWYTLGRDEGLLADNLRVGAELGSLVQNEPRQARAEPLTRGH
jgi:hypothetical protein